MEVDSNILIQGGMEPSWNTPRIDALEPLLAAMERSTLWLTCTRLSQVSNSWRELVGEWRLLQRTVELTGSISDPALMCVAQCPRLESLHLSRRSGISDAAVAARSCPNEQQADVTACASITDGAIRAVAEGCPELRVVDLSSCCALTFKAIEAMAHGCTHLHCLDLSYSGLGDAAVHALVASEVQLETLDLTACALSKEALAAVGPAFPRLTALHLSYCGNTCDETVALLAHHCRRLRTLDFFGCHQLTNLAVQVAARECAELRALHLSACSSIDDDGLRALRGLGAQLTTLHLFGNRHLSGGAITALVECSTCHLLEVLDLSSTAINDTVVLAVARHCPKLRTLYLFSCCALGEAAVLAVAKACPEPSTLDLLAQTLAVALNPKP